jgi:hypothetical protein
MDYAEGKKHSTNQTGSKDPPTDDLFEYVYFRISVLFVDHGGGLTVKQDDDGTPAPRVMW